MWEHSRTSDDFSIINKYLLLLLAGCLMRVPDADVRNQLVDTVKSFYNSVAPIQLLDGMEHLSKPKPRTFNSDIYFSRLSLSEVLLWLLYALNIPSSNLFFQLSNDFYACGAFCCYFGFFAYLDFFRTVCVQNIYGNILLYYFYHQFLF